MQFEELFTLLCAPRVYFRPEDGGGGGKDGGNGDPPAGDPPDGGDGGEGEPGEGEDENVTLTKAEVAAMRKENAQLKRAQRKAEAEAKAKADEEAKQKGEWEKLANEKSQAAEEANRKLAAFESQERVSRVARRLNFKDPSDAHLFLSEDEMDDDNAVESALNRVKAEKPYLVDEQRRSGGEVTPPDNGPPSTQQEAGGDEPQGLERLRTIKRKDT